MLKVEFLTYKNKLKHNLEISKFDLDSSFEKATNRLIMHAISEMRASLKEAGFDYDYFELKAMVLNRFYVDVENKYDVESLSYNTSIVLKPRPVPSTVYSRDNCSNYDLRLLSD